jgi:hypothetical protein
MPLKLYQRNGVWNYRGTIGPAERRSRLRGSCHTGDKDIAARQIAEIETSYWKGHFDGPAAILTFERAALMYLAAGSRRGSWRRCGKHLAGTLGEGHQRRDDQSDGNRPLPNCGAASRNRQALCPPRLSSILPRKPNCVRRSGSSDSRQRQGQNPRDAGMAGAVYRARLTRHWHAGPFHVPDRRADQRGARRGMGRR